MNAKFIYLIHNLFVVIFTLINHKLVNCLVLNKLDISSQLMLNMLFYNWSEWAKCDNHCEQARFSRCEMPYICRNTFLKETRGCNNDLCINSSLNNSIIEIVKPQTKLNLITKLLNKLKNSNNSKYAVQKYRYLKSVYTNLNSILFSPWSKWSTCEPNTCLKYRFAFCKLSKLCGDIILHETKLCLIECNHKSRNHLYSIMPNSFNMFNKNVSNEKQSKAKKKNDFEMWSRKHCGIIPNYDHQSNKIHNVTKENKLKNLLKIIGGTESIPNFWPWQLAVFNRFNEPFCGATLLNEQFAITAAHCVKKKLFIQAGKHDISTKNSKDKIKKLYVTKAFVHPDFDPEKVDNDVALIKFAHPLKLSSKIWPICLPNQSNQNDSMFHLNETEKLEGIILGWGKRYFNEQYGVEFLHEAKVPLVSNEKCKKVYPDLITPNMLCAGYDQGKIDSCAGDSGGPLLLQGEVQVKKDNNYKIEFRSEKWKDAKDKRWYLFGVTSFGEGCGEKDKYGIYAKVSNFVQWIQFTINANS